MAAIVQSLGQLEALTADWTPGNSYGSLLFYNQYAYDYATIYRTQPNVRTCVDFLARNVAQLGLHVFRRVNETDRVRLRDHALVRTLERPLPAEYKVTRYRLIESMMIDLGVYWNSYWVKLKNGEQADEIHPMGLLRIPPARVIVHGGLTPTMYEVNLDRGEPVMVPPERIVHFRGHNVDSALFGLSPLETLRRVLAEEHASGEYREGFWKNSARMAGIITRPKDAPRWEPKSRDRFKSEFEQLYSGGQNSGKTAILEEGMEWKPVAFNAQESEYLAGRKLTREECARAYHIPLPMVGILDNATFSNIKEQHKNLYQDCLGPWLAMLEQDIEMQLLGDFADREGVYVEFNIAEKLQGSFEEQTTAMQASVGRPWMTANEARARMNMPSLGGDADQLVTPLNVMVGGMASPQDTVPKSSSGPKSRTQIARMNTDGGMQVLAAKMGQKGADWGISHLVAAPHDAGSIAQAKDLGDRSTAWIGMYVPGDLAEQLAIEGGEAVEALHMTLVYLGTLPQAERDRLPNVMDDWCRTASPIRATIVGLGRFQGGGGDELDAVVALVDAPGLPEWRQSLVEDLKNNGFKPDMSHGFTPHITLIYLPADEDAPDGLPDLEFVFDKLTVSFGDVRRDYVLTGKPKSRLKSALHSKANEINPALPELRKRHEAKWAEVMQGYFTRQQGAVLGRVQEGATIAGVWHDGARWDRELAQDMYQMSMATAMTWAKQVGAAVGVEMEEADVAAWISENARAAAANINKTTRAELEDALDNEDEDDPEATPRDRARKVFELAVAVRALQIATSRVTTTSVFGSQAAAHKGGLTTKTWHTNSGNPRAEHAAMNGETVPIDEEFSNGMMWPGDPAGGADNNAGCQCSVSFGRD